MLQTAKEREFTPEYVCFDSWYSSLANLKQIRTLGWQWLTRLTTNRLVNPDGSGNRPVAMCDIRNGGTRVHLKGYGCILVFRMDPPDGDTEYWATSDLRARAQRNHIGWALRAYLRLIWHELETGTTRFTTKMAIIRPAIQAFLTDPSHVLRGFPQAGMAHKRATA